MTSVKLTKERIINCIEEILKSDASLNKSTGLRSRNTNKVQSFEVLIMRQYVAYCGLVRLMSAEFTIEPLTRNRLALIFILRKFEDFFWKHVPRIGNNFFKKWDYILAKNGFAKQDSNIFVNEREIISGHRMYLFDRRADVERSNALQKTFRQEILQKPEPSDFTMDLDIETQESLLKANLMDVEEAVLIIQCAERMYQAITRFVYLTDVRKKAMDLHADKKSLDPERAVILIQARTRGLLARNMVRRTREEEQRVLGLTVESLLKSKIAYRHKSKLINNSNPLPHSEDPKRGERIKPPSTFNDLIESFRSELFLADPLELRFNTNAGANSDMIDSFKKYEQETENLLTKLNNLGICRVLNNKDSPCFDEMTSFQADIHIHQRKHLISFDLRDFFYMSVVIPHILSGWPDSKRNRRHSILLVGDECSGKTSWASAIANKCGSVRITVGRRPTRIGRKRLFHYINQFVREDKYCVVLIDKLEVFLNDDAERKSSLKIALRELMEVLLKEDKCQVIGMSLVADLEPSILEHFSIMINIKRPPMVERFELIADTLSRRMETETLHRMPKRLVEVAKATGSMNCGRTILRTDKKFAK